MLTQEQLDEAYLAVYERAVALGHRQLDASWLGPQRVLTCATCGAIAVIDMRGAGAGEPGGLLGVGHTAADSPLVAYRCDAAVAA